MANEESGDVLSQIAELRATNYQLMAANKRLHDEMNEQKNRIRKFEKYGQQVERLVQNVKQFVDGLLPGLMVPADLRKPTSATTTAAATASVTASEPASPQTPAAATAPVALDGRLSTVDEVLVQTETLYLQSKATVQLDDHEESNGDGSSGFFVRELQKENLGEHEESAEPMTMTSSNNDAVTPRSNVDDQAASGIGPIPVTENQHQTGSDATVCHEMMDLTVPPSPQSPPSPLSRSPSPMTVRFQTPTKQAMLIESSLPLVDISNLSKSKASQGMSADKPARKNNKTSTPKSIFDTPKTRPKKKKLYADRDICNANIDIDAERTTRSMVRALNNSDSNLPDEPGRSAKARRIDTRRKTMKI